MRHALACLLAIIFSAALLQACGDVPRPFEREKSDPPNPLLEIVDRTVVYVPPVEGAPEPTNVRLAELIVESLHAENVPATLRSGIKGEAYVLKGNVTFTRKEANIDRVYVVVQWTLENKSGKQLGTTSIFLEATPDQWEYGLQEITWPAAAHGAQNIAQQLQGDQEEQRASKGIRGSVRVLPVRGAPGDGNDVLTGELKRLLKQAGINVLEGSGTPTITVSGRVRTGPPTGTEQDLLIEWRVTDAGGKELGTIRQGDKVRTRAIQGLWGSLATTVASGAVIGIEQILAQLSRSKEQTQQKPGLKEPPKYPN